MLKKAFCNNEHLKQLDITDSHTFCGDFVLQFDDDEEEDALGAL